MRAVDFREKPELHEPPRGDGKLLCSMGVYAFKTESLVRRVVADSKTASSHDFGRDVIPAMVRSDDRVFAFNFSHQRGKGAPYWRDIGTLDAYWQANMDLLLPDCPLNLYDPQWPVRTHALSAPPAKLVCAGPHRPGSTQVCESLISSGAVVQGAGVMRSVIGPDVRLGSGASVSESIIMNGICVDGDAIIRKAIVDKGNRVPAGFTIGVDAEQDRRHFTLSEGGVVVVPKEMPLFRR
jgi:glucose-1-phosphate adenylyltransferase